jgi:ligand-binding sensor domain-containing protein
MRRRIAVAAGAAMLMAAAAPAQTGARQDATGAALRVIETFEVGANVYVRALTADPGGGSMWVGTSAGAHEIELATLKPRQTFTRKDGLANEYVFAIGIDRKGHKWFGTNAGGASRYRDGQWKTFFPMHGLADYWIYAFASQKDGTLWIGTWAGANRVDARTGKFTTYVKQLVNEWVYGIGVDAKDRVWFGTEGGVSMYDGKGWRSWTHKDGLGAPNAENLPFSPNTGLGTRSRHDLTTLTQGSATFNPNYVFSIHVAADDTVWAGTWGGGVSRFDGRTWSNLTTKDGLAGDIVYAIAQGKDGAMWFGTSGGVSRYDGTSWQTFGKKEGLLEESVYALAITPKGEVWAGTRRGVARLGR